MNAFRCQPVRPTCVSRLLVSSLTIFCLCIAGVSAAQGQTVDVRVSSLEAYVGQPIVLQITIQNANDFQQPTIPPIDGCDVRSAGAPAQSSQISIINGRRSESRSVTIQYLITPRREGTFEIPALQFTVDGRVQETDPIRFVAKKSETGDLLFVEVTGNKDRVYVGQSLELTLKIWIEPFADREREIRLSEGDMWRSVSSQTNWGSFREKLVQMAQSDQRPRGNDVLRDNGQGEQQAYYLYEIDTTIYPSRPGKIDVDDVQVVVDYPTALGKARDPFDSFFGGSRLSQMMDDSFSTSPFGNRLAITATRPIAADAVVDSTRVVPVPTEGRPADYRGAVGQYKIVTQAEPTKVVAGDPIVLQIGIVGTGPMELVQAPPLSELSLLTDDFKVEDQSLAGFVRDDTKVFPTTIRPRREGITAIPEIPFSFFDPERETFETVWSNPIAITVDKAESLSLEAIVSKTSPRPDANELPEQRPSLTASFENINSLELLDANETSDFNGGNAQRLWLALVFVPPFVWLIAFLLRYRNQIVAAFPGLLGNFQSAEKSCLRRIERATSRAAMDQALIDLVAAESSTINGRSRVHAVGSLRSEGLYTVAIELEDLFGRGAQAPLASDREINLDAYRHDARKMVQRLSTAWESRSPLLVRPKASMRSKPALILLAILVLPASQQRTWGATDNNIDIAGSSPVLQLSREQRETIFREANELYARATSLKQTATAEANELYTRAAMKYQQLVDAGIQHSELYFNLGNAYFQANQLGRAIAAYERATELAPSDRQLWANLNLANSRVQGEDVGTNVTKGSERLGMMLRVFNRLVINAVGMGTLRWTLAIASLVFWGLMFVSLYQRSFPWKRIALLPLVILIGSGCSVAFSATTDPAIRQAIIVANRVILRTADGEEFSEVAILSPADGHRVEVIHQRNGWAQVKTRQGKLGWLPLSTLEALRTPQRQEQ